MDACALFHHQRFTFTGRLASMNRRQARELVRSRGGRVNDRVSRLTDCLVVGSDGWPLRPSGRLTRNLERAATLQRQGAAIDVIAEATFLKRLRLIDNDDPVHRHYNIEQLSRTVGVSGLRLRHWLSAGLIEPVEVRDDIPLFDYAQVTAIRTLWQLASNGCRASVLSDSLRRLGRWLPDASRTAESLERIHGMLVVRTADGDLVDARGQKLFDFAVGDDAVASLSWSYFSSLSNDPDRAFEDAVRWERSGDAARAIEAYEVWLERFGDDPDVLMNLGNQLIAAGQSADAAERFRRAVRLRTDDCRLWNNLGLALADAGEMDEAITALNRSVRCDPDFADAYYNLADILEDRGQSQQARLLWRKYLQFDATSEHGEYAQKMSMENARG